MKSLQDAFEQLDPGQASIPNRQTDQELSEGITRAALATGRALDHFRAAVVIGYSGLSGLHMLAKMAPNLDRVLIVEPDSKRLHRTELNLSWAACYLANVDGSNKGYDSTVYREVCQFVMDGGLALERVLFWPDPLDLDSDRADLQPILRALSDLRWHMSSAFFDFVDQSEWSTSFYLNWASHLVQSAQPFHALVFLIFLFGLSPKQELANIIVDCFMALGCHSLALNWLGKTSLSNQKRQKLRRQLEQLRKQAERSKAKLYQNNLALLKNLHENVYEKVVAHKPTSITLQAAEVIDVPSVVNLHSQQPIALDNYFVFFYLDQNRIRLVNPPVSIRPIYDLLKSIRSAEEAHAILGTVRFHDRLFALFANRILASIPNWHQILYVLEPNMDIFTNLLNYFDLKAVLSNPGLKLFVGPQGPEELVDSFLNNPKILIPSLKIDLEQPIINALKQIELIRLKRTNALMAQSQGKYAQRPGISLFDKLAKAEPLRVLIPTSHFTTVLQYVARDLEQAFTQLGHEVMLLKEDNSFEHVQVLNWAEAVHSFEPDLVFLIDHIRSEYNKLLPDTLPVVCWAQDPLPNLFDPKLVSKLGDLDFTYGITRNFCRRLQNQSYPHVGLLLLSVNAHIYHPTEQVPQDRVAYITNLTAPKIHHQELFEHVKQQMFSLHQQNQYTHNPEEMLSIAEQELKLVINPRTRASLLSDVSGYLRYLDRIQMADWMLEAGIDMALYGNGWSDIERFRPFAKGFVKTGAALCEVYQRSKVVLHINMGVNLHNRVFEAFSSGGFVLARSNPSDHLPGELADWLEIGKEIIMFSSREELVQVVQRAFTDESWRAGVIMAAQSRIGSQHCYTHRIETVLRDIASSAGFKREHAL